MELPKPITCSGLDDGCFSGMSDGNCVAKQLLRMGYTAEENTRPVYDAPLHFSTSRKTQRGKAHSVAGRYTSQRCTLEALINVMHLKQSLC